jgi:lipoate-protein ligase A
MRSIWVDINFLKNFENVTQHLLKESEFFKKQQEISNMIVNQSFNSMIKQQGEISKIAQIQLDLLKNNSSIFSNITQDLFKNKGIIQQTVENLIYEHNQFLKKESELTSLINAVNKTKITLNKDNSIKSMVQNLLEENQLLKIGDIQKQLLENFSKEFQIKDNLDIKYEDIEKINKKIEQKEAFSKKDLLKLIRFLEILWLFYSIYSALNPDNLEHIKTQQMINSLDNKISKSLKQELYYEITKQVNVRELADSKSKKIAVTNPKQKLLIIQNKPYWLQVEYFDEIKNETIIGWVSKKYTKRLD